jgi:hypothetical protein
MPEGPFYKYLRNSIMLSPEKICKKNTHDDVMSGKIRTFTFENSIDCIIYIIELIMCIKQAQGTK